MTRRLAAARLLIIAIIAVLSAASPACAGRELPDAALRAPAPRPLALAADETADAGPSTTVLDINGSGTIRLHNRFLVGGLILYTAFSAGALVFLDKRRVAAAVILAAGLIIGGLLLVRAFG
jgi:hypothetical protein